MKRFLPVAMLLLLCCTLCIGVCAEDISYTDALSGIRITLPDGWDYVHVEDTDPPSAWFMSEKDDTPAITFFAMDAYAMERPNNLREALDWIPLPRIDYNNSKLPIESIAKELGVNEFEVTKILLKGREYFCMEAVLPEGSGTGTSALLFREENGFFYAFRFWESADHPQYPDFLDMIANAEYPIYSMNEKTVIMWELLIILVSFVLHCLPIIIFRYGFKKVPLENAKEVSIIYGGGAVCVGWVLGIFLGVTEIGVCAVGIVIGAIVNYRMLSK